MKSLKIMALVMGILMILSGAAMAAQASYTDTVNGITYYAPTPTGTNFDANGTTNYPYEIYLPNEENPEQYRIHSNYTKNTDACASCHATHTAVGASLLQWYSTYETCMACHDGTVTTTYNVEDGKIGKTLEPTFGGHFGNGSEADLSSHNVTGAVTITAAPGGSTVAQPVTTDGGKTINVWGATFGCESCHTPHGQGGNARILSPDPNGAATLYNTKSYDVEPVTGAVYDENGNHVTLIKGYPYVNKVNNNTVESASYVIYNGLGYSVIQPKIGSTLPAGIISVTGTAAIQVTMNIENYLGLNSTDSATYESVKHVSGINTFCGGCHTDYNTEAQVAVNGSDKIMGTEANRPGYGALTGKYSQAHRHAVGVAWNYGDAASDKYIGDDKLMKTMGGEGSQVISCLTCHFAHGTSVDFWAAWTNKFPTVAADGWGSSLTIQEIAGSSALKRLPNMATCEACHQKGDAAEGYLANSSTNLTYQEESNTEDALFVKILGNLSAAEYVDEINSPNLCTTSCHTDYVYNETDYAKHLNVAAFKTANSIPAGTDVLCQSCHGPASLHVKAPSSINIINPNMTFNKNLAVDSVCAVAGCHVNVASQWKTDKHSLNAATGAGANCVDCHDNHEGKTHNSLAMKTGTAQALCTSCHITQTPTITTAIQAINADGSYKFGHNYSYNGDYANDATSTNKAFAGSTWVATKSKLSTRTLKALDGKHTNLATTALTSSCWGESSECHASATTASPGGNAYQDFTSSIHFSQAGTTEGLNDVTNAADFNGAAKGIDNYAEPKGMRNRY